ncbi:MAG: thiamine pyrophosphate-dependent enzyme, partial [Chloroflexota bacterium]|nr:thiamine pyrophosphate-dependent enzyme [Chloroflexota bacterium]
MIDLEQFYGPNAGYVLELYERYQADPEAVEPSTRRLFETWSPPAEPDTATVPAGGDDRALSSEPESSDDRTPPAHELSLADIDKVVGAARLIRVIREYGHLAARIDPLGSEPPGDAGLGLATHGLTEADLDSLPARAVSGPLKTSGGTLLDVVRRLREMYCGSIGYDYDQVQDSGEREWIRDAIESCRFSIEADPDTELALLEQLVHVEVFEQFLHKTFPGQKWFSIEGLDMLVPMLNEIIARAADAGTREVVIGIAHRGRLNVMAHVLGQPYETIIGQFLHTASRQRGTSASDSASDGWTGDVKYHLGATRRLSTEHARAMPITLAPNPSHLEFVNPVVEGRARAAQEKRDRPGMPVQDDHASLAILIHGDASFPGQGIVAETLNLSRLRGYTTGGTIHIIANNQLGFTTDPREARSTLYAG